MNKKTSLLVIEDEAESVDPQVYSAIKSIELFQELEGRIGAIAYSLGKIVGQLRHDGILSTDYDINTFEPRFPKDAHSIEDEIRIIHNQIIAIDKRLKDLVN